MATQVEELPDNKVRVTVEVPRADLKHAVEHATHDLAESVKIPGFRKGKVPPQVLEARIGRERIFTEAVESHIGGWFLNAAANTRIRPVAAPEYDYDLPASEDEKFSFTATVAVQPKPEPADWSQLEVPYAEPDVPSEVVDQELEALRETVAELAPVEDRPARTGDVLVIDALDENGEGQRDLVVELGAGRLVEEIERALTGASAGETRDVEFETADDSTAKATVEVKEIKEKVLPEADDELARSASEFETFEELRAEIESRLLEQLTEELEIRFREAAVDALVNASEVETVEPLVERRTAELWSGIAQSLQMRGISTETYLTMTGQSADEVVARLRAEAEQSLARELVLDAAASKLGVEVPDEEIDELIESQSEEGDDIEESKRLLQENGGYERIRADLRLKKALDEIVAGVKRIPVELAAARDKLWTPEKEKEGTKMNIWTPGSEEAR